MTVVGTTLLAAVTAALLSTACSSGDSQGDRGDTTNGNTATSDTATRDTDNGDTAPTPSKTALTLVDRTAGVSAPMDAHPVGDSLLVAQRSGEVVELRADDDAGYELVDRLIDLRDEVGSTEGERGLLGITTDSANEHLYLNHTRARDGATVILELPLKGEPGDLRVGDTRQLLVIDQPFANHNGGDLAWGPDDKLWVGTGDGGGADDPEGRAQRLTDPLGKILRIDPTLVGTGEDLAASDNPYISGDDGHGGAANPLVWARGVRNPWRISFDDATGDLWIADVGQNEVEEITVLRAADGLDPGADLGWDHHEGDREFAGAGPRDGWLDDDATTVDPLFSYTHDEGCSISGGFVYHGEALAGLVGRYLFSDYCTSDIRSVDQDGSPAPLGINGTAVVSINADEHGEPLVLDSAGISRISPG